MRSKNVIYNIISGIILQIIIIVYGLIIPKLIITQYGSSVNGLISSISQFLSFITILELGFGPIVLATLYKPIAKKKNLEIINILKSANVFFHKISYVFIFYIIILCIFYPIIVNSTFDTWYTISLIVIISISTFIEYYFGITYRLFLQALQKEYILSIISIITHILTIISIIILIKCNASIQIIKLVSAIIFIIRPTIQYIYVKKKYDINLKLSNKKFVFKQKWDGLVQHIAYVIHQNTDIIVISFFCPLEEVSVYSVYYLVVKSIKSFIQAFANGIKYTFGDMIAKKESVNLKNKFNVYETIFFTICTIIFTCTIILIVPFVSIYTKEIHDVNYIRYTFGYLIVISEYIWAIRLPFSTLSVTAGHFKQTKKGAIIEALINIIVSIILVSKHGIVGVAIGTIVAMTIRTIEFVFYVNKHILCRNIIVSFKKILLIIIETIICIYLSKYLIIFENCSLSNWVINSIILLIATSIIIITINSLFYNKTFKELINILKKRKNINSCL